MKPNTLPMAGLVALLLSCPVLAQEDDADAAGSFDNLEQRLESQQKRLRELDKKMDESEALGQRIQEQSQRIRELEQARYGSGSGSTGPAVDVSGFVNAGFQSTNLGKNEPDYRFTDHEVRATNFTSAGVQFNGNITDKVSGLIQLLAEGRKDFNTRVEWAYLQYEFNSSVKARAGRIVAPFYMNSQSFYVGYAHPWVEPPAEVYDTAAVRNFEGADITWQFNTGDVAHSLNYYFGNAPVDSTVAGTPVVYDVHNIHGLNLSSTLGNLNTWLAYNNGDVTLDLPSACISSPGPTPPNPPSCGFNFNDYSLENDDAYFGSAGFEYNNGNLLFTAEHVELDIKGWFPKSRGHYATLGYRFGSWMPHVTWASTETVSFSEVEGDTGAEILYNQVKTNQNSWTLGLRGDVAPGLAIKAEASTYYNIGKRNNGVRDSGLFSGPIPADEDDPMVFRLSANLAF